MKTKTVQIVLAMVLFVSCGPKPSHSIATITKENDTYISKINADSNLKKEITEGALTDKEGFKDIGKFKYTVYFDERTKELYKIENVEMTDRSISETYYFKNGDLVLIASNLQGTSHKMYVQSNKVVSADKMDRKTQQLLLEKAKRFQKNFKKEH